MVEKLAKKIIGQMVDERMVDEKQEENYIYAFITMVERTVTVLSILILSAMLRCVVPTILFLSFFFSLRKRTGGFHADKFWQCYLETIAAYLVITAGCYCFQKYSYMWNVLAALSIVVIEIIGTVNHPNVNMNQEEFIEAKKSARMIAAVEGGIVLASIFIQMEGVYITFMEEAIILCAVLMGLAKICRQEVTGKKPISE